MMNIHFAGADGNKLVADAAGPPQGHPVILLPGIGQTRRAWRHTAARVNRAGFRTISVDQRGHGDSDWVTGCEYTLDAYARDALAIARQLDHPALVGASLGGAAALLVAGELDPNCLSAVVLIDVAARPEPDGVARISQFMSRTGKGFASLEEAAVAVAAYGSDRSRSPDPSGLRHNLRRRDDDRWYWHWDPRVLDLTTTFAVHTPRLERAAESLRVPAMVVRGSRSDMVSPEGLRQFQHAAAHTEIVDVADAGHMMVGDANNRFTDGIVGFLVRSIPQKPVSR